MILSRSCSYEPKRLYNGPSMTTAIPNKAGRAVEQRTR